MERPRGVRGSVAHLVVCPNGAHCEAPAAVQDCAPGSAPYDSHCSIAPYGSAPYEGSPEGSPEGPPWGARRTWKAAADTGAVHPLAPSVAATAATEDAGAEEDDKDEDEDEPPVAAAAATEDAGAEEDDKDEDEDEDEDENDKDDDGAVAGSACHRITTSKEHK